MDIVAAVVVGLLLGALAGVVIGMLAGRSRAAAVFAERDAARAELEGVRAQVESVRTAGERTTQAAEQRAGAAEHRASVAEQRSAAAHAQAAALQTALDHERASAADVERRLREAFGSLAADALRSNNDSFIRLASERFSQATTAAKGDLAQREQAIKALVDPLAEQLKRLDERARQLEKERTTEYAGLKTHVAEMIRTSEGVRRETAQLVSALRAPQIRGRWGEMQLRRIVEAAGMVEHCDFSEQHTVKTADGVQRPDVVIQLAGGKSVVIDAKVPYESFLAAQTGDTEARQAKLVAHAKAVRDHVKKLADKAYWDSFDDSPEFVVMFMPGETLLASAWEADPGLVEFATENHVVIATPTTLIALLRTIAYAWKQDALTKNARQVQSLAKELYSRLATMGGHVERLGNALDGAVKAYNQSVGSLEGRVLVSARRLAELKVSDDHLPEPTQIDRTPRAVSAPELVASASEQLLAFEDLDHRVS
ncbi:DNA recombination protein RmuC [Fodinicola acaciae]|uniref:DNA recombination protein RmuC n=1 Tax=Fodinicola acaciae TaxID=2681555 RepID=UPI0013D80CCB|nr:DNA recombination protein RmuC [Fodinicola acaciae]